MDTQLDPSIVAMTKAIGQSESGGNYAAKGKSGEYGAYQYTKPTWDADARKYLGNAVPLEQATPAQQDEVAYKKIKDLGSQGYKPDQVASIWNSGKPEYEGNVGTNKYGVHFDTPAYVKSVGANYEKIIGGKNAVADPANPSYVPGSTPTQNEDGFITSAKLPEKPAGVSDVKNLEAGGAKEAVGGVVGTLSNLAGTTKLGQGLGYAASNAAGTQDDFNKTNDMLIETQSKLLEAIKHAKETGRDHARLDKALSDLTAQIKTGGEQSSNIGTGGITNKQVLGSAAQTAVTAATLPSLISGTAGLFKGSQILKSPAVEAAMSKFNMPMAEFESLSAGEKLNALTEALKTSSPAGKLVLQQAIDEIAPAAIKEAGGKVAFAKLYPKLATVGGLIGTLLKGAGGVAVGAGIGSQAANVYHKLVR